MQLYFDEQGLLRSITNFTRNSNMINVIFQHDSNDHKMIIVLYGDY